MALNESGTRAKLIDPALKSRGWTEGRIRREESAGRIAIIGGKPVQARNGRTDYTLRIQIQKDAQPLAVAVAVVEAKAEDKHPGHGLEQSKGYSRSLAPDVPSRSCPRSSSPPATPSPPSTPSDPGPPAGRGRKRLQNRILTS